MRIVKALVGIVIALIATIFVVGQFLPSEQHVERSIVVNADQATVFALVNDFGEFNRWSPWAAKDPETEYVYSGPDSGVGSKMAWRSEDPNVGSGEQEIVDSQPPTMVKTKLTFDGFDTASYATFAIEAVDSGTRVTWAFDANLDTLMGRYMGLMMDSWVGADYESGLTRLKEVAEGGE
ncbi:MAG: SRPBCC family protein [Woeseiaceae bacterium]|nr:SRPBCC family protein [Woeseiaceae bacterium]